MPQISVIVPVYKVEPYLRRCVDSILNQTFTDFELILVDDGSPDGCPAICDDYALQDPRVRVIHQKNGGLSAARNAGIDWAFENSDSEWITFIDSDDWIHPEMVKSLYYAAKDNNLQISICSYVNTTDLDIVYEPITECIEIVSPEYLFITKHTNAVIACAKLYRKALFNEIRYPVGVLHEDEFTTYKLLFAVAQCAFIAQPMYFYYQNSSSIMHSAFNMKHAKVYDSYEDQIDFFRKNGFDKAKKWQIHNYLLGVTKTLNELSSNKNQNKQIIQNLRIRKHKHFTSYANQLDPHDDQDAWVLSAVFPKSMWIYWHWRALKRKVMLFGGQING